jgi:mRNA interferase RelE/StbE
LSARRIDLTRAAERDLRRLGADDRRAVVAALEAFAADASADIKKLVGAEPPRWRLRVGRFRAIMSLEPGRIIVERIGDRRDVYR